MPDPNDQIDRRLLKTIIVSGIIAAVIFCALILQQSEHARRINYISSRIAQFKSLHGSAPLTAADASSTQAWMTFDYINHVFALPTQYLQTLLAVTDSRYPRLTISKYAQSINEPQSTALSKVQDAIRSYFTAKQ